MGFWPYNMGVKVLNTPIPNRLITLPAPLRIVMLALIVLLASISLAQPAPSSSNQVTTPISVPASRQADRVAVITIEGAIDRITAMSVRRRITEAENSGFNAMVFEINSPGGGVGAVLDITNAIKSSSILNTVAWVNTDAYSGGAIIALACKEIVSSSPAAMGDAFPVIMTTVTRNNTTRGGLRGLTPDERTKLLPPLLADVTDSARRNGYDEYLVQAIVIDGIELWQIEDTQTLQRYAINEQEYRTLFHEDPPRGMPLIAQVTGGRPTGVTDANTEPDANSNANSDDISDDKSDADQSTDNTLDDELNPVENPDSDPQSTPQTDQQPDQEQAQSPSSSEPNPAAFKPASDTLDDVVREFESAERIAELTLETSSARPVFTSSTPPNRYIPIAYITDGSAPIVMREQQLIDLGFSAGIIANDMQLMQFMGAQELARVDESWSEGLVRFMTSLPVRGIIIAIMLIAIFVELVTAGTGIGGSIAVIALIALIAPPAMIGLAGWWEIIAIVFGILLLLVEAFITPGFGVFGVIGFVLLFAGILWTFIPTGSSLSNPNTQQDLLNAGVVVILATFTAGVVMWLISRNLTEIPIFNKLALSGASGIGAESKTTSIFNAMKADDSLHAGQTGIATTPLRPSGQAEIGDRIIDVVAEFGFIESGTPIRIVAVESFRTVVDRVHHDEEGDTTQSSPTSEHDQDQEQR